MATHHLCHAHGGVVHHHGQLVTEHAARAGHNKIAADAVELVALRAENVVKPVHLLPGGAEPPGEGPVFILKLSPMAGMTMRASARVGRRFVLRMGGGGGTLHVRTGASTWIDVICGNQSVERRLIDGRSFTLHIRPVRAAAVGAFVPRQAQPGEIGAESLGQFGAGTFAVDVLDPQQELARAAPGAVVRLDGGPGMAKVERAIGAGGEAGAQHDRTRRASPVDCRPMQGLTCSFGNARFRSCNVTGL